MCFFGLPVSDINEKMAKNQVFMFIYKFFFPKLKRFKRQD